MLVTRLNLETVFFQNGELEGALVKLNKLESVIASLDKRHASIVVHSIPCVVALEFWSAVFNDLICCFGDGIPDNTVRKNTSSTSTTDKDLILIQRAE